MGEFVHVFLDSFQGVTPPAIVVADIEQGTLAWIATVREWEWGAGGHLPTVRARLAARRGGRRVPPRP